MVRLIDSNGKHWTLERWMALHPQERLQRFLQSNTEHPVQLILKSL